MAANQFWVAASLQRDWTERRESNKYIEATYYILNDHPNHISLCLPSLVIVLVYYKKTITEYTACMQSSKVRLFVQSLSGLAEYYIYCSMAGPSGSEPTELTASVLWATPWAAHNMLIYTLSIHTHTHTTLHMCCFISIHGCNSCNSCVLVCTWIDIKA